MNRTELIEQIRRRQTFLCVGLDSDPERLPEGVSQGAEGVLLFNKNLIDATASYTLAYKPNAAFYEALGWEGQKVLEETISYIKEKYPHHFIILDAKRGDIGNTSDLYARSAFRRIGADAVTVAPYMGEDSISPFLSYEGKWVILLALTSNKGSLDFQHLSLEDRGVSLYEYVLEKSSTWGSDENIMYVAGATQAELFATIRKHVPNHFLLVPGVGAQGGSLREVCHYGLTKDCGLIVNSSRSIIFASRKEDYADAASKAARLLQEEMKEILQENGIV